MPTPQSFLQVIPGSPFGYIPTPGGTASISQNVQTVKVGLNYKIGEDIYAQWAPSTADYHLRGATDVAGSPAAKSKSAAASGIRPAVSRRISAASPIRARQISWSRD